MIQFFEQFLNSFVEWHYFITGVAIGWTFRSMLHWYAHGLPHRR